MCGEKRQQLINRVLDMTDKEADILAVFLDGFRAGKQTIEKEIGEQRHCRSAEHTS